MLDSSEQGLRNAIFTRFSKTSVYENLVTKLSFTDKRFSILPIACVVKDVLTAHPEAKGDLTDLQLEHRVFVILRSLLRVRKELKDMDVASEKLHRMASLFDVELKTPFSGFILEKDSNGRFIRFRNSIPYTGFWNNKKRKQERRDTGPSSQLLQQHQTRIYDLEKELRETNRNYAATVEENDALLDELDTAKSSIAKLTRNNDRERKSLKAQLVQYEETVTMLQFEIAEIAEKAPETQAVLVSLNKDRDRARSEADSCRKQLEEYDRYTTAKFREFRRVARMLVKRDQVSKEAACAVVDTIKGDVFACRASAWAKEKEKLLWRIEEKEDTEMAIEAEGMMCLCQRKVKRCKLACGHSLCTGCVDKVKVCPYCRTDCEVSLVFEP